MHTLSKRFTAYGLLLGVTAIVFGAFGAHALKKVLTPEALNSYQTAVQYQMYMSFWVVVLLRLPMPEPALWRSVRLALGGSLLFSGSIYLLVLLPLIGFSFKMFGWVTPLGGLLMIAAFFQPIRYFFSKLQP